MHRIPSVSRSHYTSNKSVIGYLCWLSYNQLQKLSLKFNFGYLESTGKHKEKIDGEGTYAFFFESNIILSQIFNEKKIT